MTCIGIAIHQVSPGFFTKHFQCISWKLIEGNFKLYVDWESILYPEIVYHILNYNPRDVEYSVKTGWLRKKR